MLNIPSPTSLAQEEWRKREETGREVEKGRERVRERQTERERKSERDRHNNHNRPSATNQYLKKNEITAIVIPEYHLICFYLKKS